MDPHRLIYTRLCTSLGMVLVFIATTVSTSYKTFCHYYASYSYSLGDMCGWTLSIVCVHTSIKEWASKGAHMHTCVILVSVKSWTPFENSTGRLYNSQLKLQSPHITFPDPLLYNIVLEGNSEIEISPNACYKPESAKNSLTE